MRHLNDGQIKAFQDHELAGDQSRLVAAHLEACERCRAKAVLIMGRNENVTSGLDALAPEQEPVVLSPGQARARFANLMEETQKESNSMWNKFFSRVPRAAWVTLAIVAVLAVSLAFPSVRAIANNFLGLFRVEQVRVVQINPADLPDQLGSSSNLESIFAENVQFSRLAEPEELDSLAQAVEKAGFGLRLPAALQGEPRLFYQPGGSAVFNVDLALVRSVLKDIGRDDIKLPSALDGAEVEVVVPSAIMAGYGECDIDVQSLASDFDPDDPRTARQIAKEMPDCTTLLQLPSPTISAPPGLDLSTIGEAYLQILGMEKGEAERFARNVDWTTTFVVPIPRYGVEYQDITVDGVTGTLLHHGQMDSYALVWVKDGILYALSGPGDGEDAAAIANSLK